MNALTKVKVPSLLVLYQNVFLLDWMIYCFREQLFTVACNSKHAHYLLGVKNKIAELSR